MKEQSTYKGTQLYLIRTYALGDFPLNLYG